MKTLISTLFFSLLSISAAQANSDDEKIELLIASYEKSLNASDTMAVLKLYGENSIFMPQNSPAQAGKTVITKAYDAVFSSIKLNVTFTIHELEVLGDTAWLRTTSIGKITILENNMVINEGNNELFILKKENDHWKIHQYLFATSNPRN